MHFSLVLDILKQLALKPKQKAYVHILKYTYFLHLIQLQCRLSFSRPLAFYTCAVTFHTHCARDLAASANSRCLNPPHIETQQQLPVFELIFTARSN